MFKSYVKTPIKKSAITQRVKAPVIAAAAFSSLTAVLGVCQTASAQLNVGENKVQQGLEPYYLQQQLSGQPLNQIQGIPGCTTGFGLTCNKTVSVLEQLLESNGGSSYQDLVTKAAGGPENYQNFAAFYGNNPNLPLVPVASFWKDGDPNIMDGVQYVLGREVSRTPVAGLASVTDKFYWSPLSGNGNALSPRDGLLNLKYAFGRAFLEEVAKIPNLQQQIQSQNLSPEMTKFFTNTISQGLDALNAKDESALQQNILEVLSHPYFPSGELRPLIGIPEEFNSISGLGLPGDTFEGGIPIALEPELTSLDIPAGFEGDVLVPGGGGSSFLPWLGGLGGLALLLALLGGGGDGSSDSGGNQGGSGIIAGASDVGSINPSPGGTPPLGGGNLGNNQVIEVPPNTPINGGFEEAQKVPEPSVMKALLLLIIVVWIFGHKQRRTQATHNF